MSNYENNPIFCAYTATKIKALLPKLMGKKVILYPFGAGGHVVKKILNKTYGILESNIVDNKPGRNICGYY